jgi:phospholipid transport system substrate-binding protein
MSRLVALALAAVLLPVPALAGPPTEDLRAAADRVVRILEDPALREERRALERQAAVREALLELIDFVEISRRSLGRHWRTLSPKQQEEFVALFRELLDRTYLPQIRLYEGERIHFLGESVDGGYGTVQARVVTRRGQEVSVMFRLHRPRDRWLVYDVALEGISLVGNYRSQFNAIMQRGAYPELVSRIRQRLAEEAQADEDAVSRAIRR